MWGAANTGSCDRLVGLCETYDKIFHVFGLAQKESLSETEEKVQCMLGEFPSCRPALFRNIETEEDDSKYL